MSSKGEVVTLRFDCPEGKGFAADEKGVAGEKRVRLRSSGNDAVDESVDPTAWSLDPVDDTRIDVPRFCLGKNQGAELIAVGIDEFARDDPDGGTIGFETCDQNGEQLCRKRMRSFAQSGAVAVTIVECQTGFGGVGNDGDEIGMP